MVGQLVKKIYNYKNVELASGVVITAQEVFIVDGKVNQVNSGNARVEDKVFNFSVYPRFDGINSTEGVVYNLSNVSQDIDGQAIVNEFISFVEADIV